jgi:hypothetical protein
MLVKKSPYIRATPPGSEEPITVEPHLRERPLVGCCWKCLPTAARGQADMQIPPDLARALAANPTAAATFDQLDAANRYAIAYRLNTVKRPTTQHCKLAEYVDMLTRGGSLHPRRPRKEHR